MNNKVGGPIAIGTIHPPSPQIKSKYFKGGKGRVVNTLAWGCRNE
jgi:hypothetical protein